METDDLDINVPLDGKVIEQRFDRIIWVVMLVILHLSVVVPTAKRHALSLAGTSDVITLQVKLEILLLLHVIDMRHTECIMALHQTSERLRQRITR